ncbi:uncharacterized protein LOC125500879 [Athalia rosae]|uniref:uncharacterized protein LOC125500879 n=1 Tax=Athalia rosae TaxID=37344 RepID=UPI0020348E74|nr:uncharacterized protein LOC125500879 [Athalia rosae]
MFVDLIDDRNIGCSLTSSSSACEVRRTKLVESSVIATDSDCLIKFSIYRKTDVLIDAMQGDQVRRIREAITKTNAERSNTTTRISQKDAFPPGTPQTWGSFPILLGYKTCNKIRERKTFQDGGLPLILFVITSCR